jgi:tubulin monoglycylase TTLL3/8
MNGGSNIWIIKPVRTLLFDSDLSRGRGIKCFTKLNDILDNTLNKSKQYVVQKYIENPLLIRNKKFDIRQWVLVRNYNPPKVWCYQECYLRFCTE